MTVPVTLVDTGPLVALAVALAERLNAVDVATLNQQHFSVVRPRHCKAFNFLPL
jgi:uncharacterized protein